MDAPTSASVRAPAVAGTFYPGTPAALAAAVDGYLAEAVRTSATPRPKALVVPHAAYVYSGPIAARAFAALAGAEESITRVVLLGPAHRAYVRGLAAPRAEHMRTPLGDVTVDRDALRAILTLPFVHEDDAAHAREHSLEVELPFVQRVLPNARVVPLAVGDATPEEVATVLERLWGGDETLVLVSSDLSHYLGYEEGRALDRATCARIIALEGDVGAQHACGAAGINGLLRIARAKDLEVELLDRRSSGDTAGPRDEVVGYAALAFREKPAARRERGEVLARWARASLREALGGEDASAARPRGPWAEADAATFVTLRFTNGELQGCIGRLEPERPLAEDVADNAVAAGTRDPRAAPITLAQVDDLDVEVSVLSPLEELDARNEYEAEELLRPGVDGVVLVSHGRRATFLPVMWGTFGDAHTMIRELEKKAGLAPGASRDDFRILRYTVDKSTDPAPSRRSSP